MASDEATGVRAMLSRLSKPHLNEAGILIIPEDLSHDELRATSDFEDELARAMTEPITDSEPTQYTCGFRGPTADLVIVDEATDFACDRCSSTENVRMLTSCRDCGPVPLCAGCRDHHAEEMCEDAEYDGTLQRGSD